MSTTASSPRAQYDPETTTQEQRIASKVAETAGTSLARSRRTLYNLWDVYLTNGVAALDARMHRKAKKRLTIARADPRLVAVIDRALDDRRDMPTTTRRHCAMLVRRTLEDVSGRPGLRHRGHHPAGVYQRARCWPVQLRQGDQQAHGSQQS